MTKNIAFQGALGAYGDEACRKARPKFVPLPCSTFEDVIQSVKSGESDLAMVPIENSTYGRVADIHRLLPDSGLNIVGEIFTRVKISLLAIPGTSLKEIKKVRAHLVLLPQAKKFLGKHNIKAEVAADSAGAAYELAKSSDKSCGVLASSIAAEIYGLNILAKNIEDHAHNTTRFLILSERENIQPRTKEQTITTFVFQVRNIPAALYKALGGFATNGVNMLKLESYMLEGSFKATQFYADVEGHPNDIDLKLALEELSYFSSMVKILGVYPADIKR